VTDCDEGTGATVGATNGITTVVTTVTTTVTASASSIPSDTPKTELCKGPLTRHKSLVLWNGMPDRADMDGYSSKLWPLIEDVAAVTNALQGLVQVVEESDTNAEKDILADEYVYMYSLRSSYR
jgi:hypothetical protein